MEIFIIKFQEILIPFIIFGILNTFDLISGTTKAIKRKVFSSSKFKNHFFKLLAYILVILSCMLLDILVEYSTGFKIFEEYTPIATTICVLISLNEIISICENAHALGIKLPKLLLNILSLINDENEKIDN